MSDRNDTPNGDDKPKNLLQRAETHIRQNPGVYGLLFGYTAGVILGKHTGKAQERVEWLNLLKSMSLDPTNPAEFPMILGKEAMKALVDGDTEVVRFTSEYHPYTFLVSVK